MSEAKLPMGSDWNFEKLDIYTQEIESIGREWLGLDFYPNQIEVISSEQMLDAYSSVGMPINYSHWSFGKSFIENEKRYRTGRMGLAYEIVINSSPCISYLMEENSMPMQALVIAHAAIGHNAVFKNNYLFKQNTSADSIIDYLIFARDYITECEERYGAAKVEELLDACHALQNHGVDQYKHPTPKTKMAQEEYEKEIREFIRLNRDEIFEKTIPSMDNDIQDEQFFPKDPEENMLYFFEKYSPKLEEWEREIVRIVRKISQYFYPQRLTKTLNEGFATFTHYNILNKMYDEKKIDESFILEFLVSHTNVVSQPVFDSDYYSGMNPYALGFAMFQDIKRVCENPTDEDKEWFGAGYKTYFEGKDWRDVTKYAMMNFKDESFISQYLTPKVIRDFRFFTVHDKRSDDHVTIANIHDYEGYRKIVHDLSEQYNLANFIPQLSIIDANIKGDRTLTIKHDVVNGAFLSQKSVAKMYPHVQRLWGFDVEIIGADVDGNVLEHWTKDNIFK